MTDITVSIPGWLPTVMLAWLFLGCVSTASMMLRNEVNGYDALDGLFTRETVVAVAAGPVTLAYLVVSVFKDGWVVYDDAEEYGR